MLGSAKQRINMELAKHLQDDRELERKAMLGFAYARKHFTNTYVDSTPQFGRSGTDYTLLFTVIKLQKC
jgi:hypothetical protein